MKVILLAVLLAATMHTQAASVIIKGKDIASDSIQVFITIDEATSNREKRILTRQGTDFFLITQYSQPYWISLKEGNNFIMGVLSPGDSVVLSFHSASVATSFSASGRGACNYFPRSAWPAGSQLLKKYPISDPGNIATSLRLLDDIYHHYRDSLSSLLCTDNPSRQVWLGLLTSEFNWTRRRLIGKAYPDQALSRLAQADSIPAYVKKTAAGLLQFDDAFHVSPVYINDVYYTLLQDYMTLKLNQQADGTTQSKYNFYLHYLPSGPLRQQVLYLLLETDFMAAADTDVLVSVINQCYPASQVDIYTVQARLLPQRYHQQFGKGQPAPDFALADSTGQIIRLNDLRGKVLVLDFWYEACMPCHLLFAAMKPLKRKYAGRPDIVFINISIDNTATWLAALRKRTIDGLHLHTGSQGDGHPVLAAYGVKSYPAVFIIDQQGCFHSAAPPVGNMEAFEREIEGLLKSRR